MGEIMKCLAYLSLGLLCLCLAGCDGYGISLYLQPKDARVPLWTSSEVIIPIQGNEDVRAIVKQAANALGMQSDPKYPNNWFMPTSGQDHLEVHLENTADDCWTVRLLDWPSFTRSEQSKQLEQKIREGIKATDALDKATAIPAR